jgi:hypothetical protein
VNVHGLHWGRLVRLVRLVKCIYRNMLLAAYEKFRGAIDCRVFFKSTFW